MEAAHPLHVFWNEHQAALTVLERLLEVVESLKRDELEDAKHELQQILPFFSKDLPAHFCREEEGLFPVMGDALSGPGPLKVQGEVPDICSWLYCDALCNTIGPLAVYLREHRDIVEVVGALKQVANRFCQSDGELASVQHNLAETIGDVRWLLGSHIAKENEVLLPKAAEVLDSVALNQLERVLLVLQGLA